MRASDATRASTVEYVSARMTGRSVNAEMGTTKVLFVREVSLDFLEYK